MPVSRHLCPVNQGFFCPYRVTAARRFLMRSAACLRVIRFRQSGQYLTLFDFDTKNVPHSVQRFLSSVFISSAYKSVSAGSTAIRNHLHKSEQEMSCGQTHSSPSSSKIQCPRSQLQHSFFTRLLTFRLCGGVSRLPPVILHQRRK